MVIRPVICPKAQGVSPLLCLVFTFGTMSVTVRRTHNREHTRDAYLAVVWGFYRLNKFRAGQSYLVIDRAKPLAD